MNLRALLELEVGRGFIRYLFKSLDVGEFPPLGVDGPILHDRLGFLRVGNQIFKLASEANPLTAAELLAQIEKERCAELYKQDQI